MENEIIINGVTYVKKEEKKKSKRRDEYWYITKHGNIYSSAFIDNDEKPFCYPTEIDCVKARDKMLALYKIKEYAGNKRGEFIPDWSDCDQKKYYICYSHDYNKYGIEERCLLQHYMFMYQEKHEHCTEIIYKFKHELDILFDIKS